MGDVKAGRGVSRKDAKGAKANTQKRKAQVCSVVNDLEVSRIICAHPSNPCHPRSIPIPEY
jgi:hypothetical protein